jgi:hypothetical protein
MSLDAEKFWQEVNALVTPVNVPDLEYHWHYDDSGQIYACSMMDHPESESYVIVDKKIYDRYFDYVVVQGRPVKVLSDAGHRVRLKKSTDGGVPVVAGHAALILESTESHTDIEYYAYRNH